MKGRNLPRLSRGVRWVLLIGGLATGGAFWLARQRDQRAAAQSFEREAAQALAPMVRSLREPMVVVRAMGALLSTHPDTSRAKFEAFAGQVKRPKNTSVHAIWWAPQVGHDQRQDLESAARGEGLMGFNFRTLGPGGALAKSAGRERYLPVLYSVPRDSDELGFDLYSDPERAALVTRARDQARMVVSDRVALLGDPAKKAIAFFQPVFSQPVAKAAISERKRSFVGVAVVAVDLSSTLGSAWDKSTGEQLMLTILDPQAKGEQKVVFESQDGGYEVLGPQQLQLERSFPVADRTWKGVVQPGLAYSPRIAPWRWLVLGLGGGATLLVALALLARNALGAYLSARAARSKRGSYRIGPEIRESSLGVVYLGEHEDLQRPVAVDVAARSSPVDAGRLRREARVLARIEHPGLIAVYDCGISEDGRAYLVTELVRGLTLREMVDRFGPLSQERCTGVLRQVLDVLAVVHQRSLVHRNVSPDSVLLAPGPSGTDRVKLWDFGTVSQEAEGDMRLTATGRWLGQEKYQAPEQFEGKEDPRSDLYSVGCLGYYLLTGAPPFPGPSPLAVRMGHLKESPPTLSDVAQELSEFLARLLAKQPEDRFADAFAALDALPEFEPSTQRLRGWWRDEGVDHVIPAPDSRVGAGATVLRASLD